MGVKDLWHIAATCEERVSLHQLRGETLAVDLAGWVVQNQTAPGLSYQVTRPHLRNLFFRTATLLGLDILPVFVLDGEAPLLKSSTMAARNIAAWGPGKNTGTGPGIDSPKKQKRRQFGAVLRDCANLLNSLGVPCVTAPGEAEAYCAALNMAGVVSGVISDDSDCLCYGALVVYRNFSTDPKNFSVSRYTAQRLRSEIGLSRERVVGLALLLGCDYSPGGVAGVGREAVIKMFNLWGEPSSGDLERILSWTDTQECVVSKPVHCGTCGHPGSVGQHRKSGCSTCGGSCRPGISCPCEYHSDSCQQLLAEEAVRRKALNSPGWPHRDVVAEFFTCLKGLPRCVEWKSPAPASFLQVCQRRMDWEEGYALDKFLSIVTRWQVRHHDSSTQLLKPVAVIKKRVQGGQDMVEADWSSLDRALPNSFTACVPLKDFLVAYPDLWYGFETAKAAKKKTKKPGAAAKKSGKENAEPSGGQGRSLARKPGGKKDENQPAISQFLKPATTQKAEAADRSASATREESRPLDKSKEPLPKPKNVIIKKKVTINKKAITDGSEARTNYVPPNENILLNVDITPIKVNEKDGKDFIRTVDSGGDEVPDDFDLAAMRNVLARIAIDKTTKNKTKGIKPLKNETFDVNDSDIREYMEETYDSELSFLVDDIVGNSRNRYQPPQQAPDLPDEVTSSTTNLPSHNLASSGSAVSTSTPQSLLFGHHLVKTADSPMLWRESSASSPAFRPDPRRADSGRSQKFAQSTPVMIRDPLKGGRGGDGRGSAIEDSDCVCRDVSFPGPVGDVGCDGGNVATPGLEGDVPTPDPFDEMVDEAPLLERLQRKMETLVVLDE